MLIINVTQTHILLNDKVWCKKTKEDLGTVIRNLLFYENRNGENDYKIVVNGKNETSKFKKEVKAKYQNINNVELRNDIFKYTNVK